MTVLNFTFQEASPLITYTGVWAEGNPAADPFSTSYNGSFRVTQTTGSSASFQFTGTAVSLFGATRPNHGNYTVNIDHQPQFTALGFTNVEAFNKSLWHANDLGYTQHTVTLANVPIPNQPFLDLDFVSIERRIGQPGDTIFQVTFDDTSPSVNFLGPWESATGVSSAHLGTLHSTKTANATVSFSFHGCSIEVYGQYANAPYKVILDNQQPVSLQGLDVDLTASFQHPQTLLYLADGLSEVVNHTVTLTNTNSNDNRPFFFDFAVVSSIHDLNATATPISPSPGDRSGGVDGSKHGIPIGAIAGGIVAALALVVAVGISALVVIRRRRRCRAENRLRLDLIEEEPKPYILPTDISFDGESYEQPQSQDRSKPLVPPGAIPFAPSSKFRPAIEPYRTDQSTSAEGLLSPQGRTDASGSTSHVHTHSLTTATVTSRPTVALSPASALTPPQDLKRRLFLQGGADGSSQEQAVQEVDAGVVLDPEEAPVSKSLPPAYNPDWDQNRS